MGAVDLGAGGDRKKKGGSGVKKPKRLGFVLDMTPLVDIAFLLLTFFMFATTMTQPKMMEMRIPPDIDIEVIAPVSKMLNIYVAEDGDIFYRLAADTTFHSIELSEVRNFAVTKNAEMDNERIVSLMLHPMAPYGKMVSVLDELNKAESILTDRYAKENIDGGERKRKFSIQRLDSLDKISLEQL